VKESRLPEAAVLVDHVTDETFPLVRACGYWAGLTLQPGGVDPALAVALLSRNGAEQVVLTSDVGEGATDLLAIPRGVEALRKAGLSDELARRVVLEGPARFVGVRP
jgi:uncharacterized protein